MKNFKDHWLKESEMILKMLDDFENDESSGLDEEEKYEIRCRCEPTFITQKNYIDDEYLEDFIKLYYDYGKKSEVNNKISNHVHIKDEFIRYIINDYLLIHSTDRHYDTYCYKVLGFEVPTKKDIVHLLNVYKVAVYRNQSQIQSVFKKLFDNPNLSLSKADTPIKILKKHSNNPYEL